MDEELKRFQERPIGEQVRVIRERLRISQVGLARVLGISQAAVSQMESGSKMRGETLDRIASALHAGKFAGSLVPPWLGGGEVPAEQEDWD